MNHSLKVAVIGAGPAGLTAACELMKSGAQVEVFEAGASVGGMARSFDLWGQRVDLGPHRFFSSDARVNKVWLEYVGSDYDMVDRLTRIYYRGKFFQYPLKAFNALENLGPVEAVQCMGSYARERLRPTPQDGTFENWVVSRFGRRLYEIFFKTYSEKLWGISCRELDADFAAQRIKKLSLLEAIKNAVLGGKDTKHKTLVEQFAYPLQGAGAPYEQMAKLLRQRGHAVHLKTPVERVVVENGRVVGLQTVGGDVQRFDHIISSMPLTQLVQRLPHLPANVEQATQKLTFRNTILVYLKVDADNLFPDQWLYIHSSNLKTGRITNFRNWVPQLYGQEKSTIVALEYWCYDEDALWSQQDSALIPMATDELRLTRLIGDAPVSAGHVVRVPRCYPVYRRGYAEALSVVEKHVRSFEGLQVIGRYGSFKYNNQDHSILMGLLAAENLVSGAKHDLWQINTDYDSYQEEAVITKTGLVSKPLANAA